ncbi:hypothetical protein HY041_02160 [Candidatus Roizmanbacteria bacterium]|nr:hypothetical protein [Candidatus Roizmanbacteria bacterium]
MWKILDKLGFLLVNIFNAVKFAAYDYDAKLKITKTPQQRMMTWAGIIFVTAVSIFTILMMIGSVVKPFLNKP